MGFASVESARKQLEALVAEGRLVKLGEGRSRSYRLAGERRAQTTQVPLIGEVAAGGLELAVQQCEGYVAVESPRASGSLFALRVRGESMKDAAILPDDIVIVRRAPRAESGQIVVAQVDGDATVKRFKLWRGKPMLQPENAAFEPIRPDPDQLEILGVVIEVRRTLH